MTAQRKKAEALVLKTMDILDSTGKNTEYYKKLFAGMSDPQFTKYVSQDFPFIFQYNSFEIEPTMEVINKAAESLGVPLMEKVYLPYYYKDENGNPVATHEAFVVYLHIKKMAQFLTKKNSMSVDIDDRDMKTGLLLSHDKNGKTTDREVDALVVMGLDKTMEEFTRPRADAMQDKSIMYSTINTLGKVNLSELPKEVDDGLANNLLDTYLLGCMLKSNILSDNYYLPYNIKNKSKRTEREY